jgi:hypothetical protein
MSPAKILVISFSPVARDPRVRRQIELLRPEHRLTVAAYAPLDDPGLEFIPLSDVPRRFPRRLQAALRLKSRRFEAYYWSTPAVAQAQALLGGRRFDLILANDAAAWPLAHALAAPHGTPVLCDAHEYAPREFEDIAWWRFLFQDYRTALCRRYLPAAAGVITVCDGIADEYARVFGIARPLVVRNLPAYHDVPVGATPPDRIRMIHHGSAMPSRRIELMIELMARLDARFSLDLMLVAPDERYRRYLQAKAAPLRRIRFLDPVAPDQIVTATRDYDVGLFLLPPTNFNYRHALPNKFFEFIQARLAVAIGPSPEMARLVRQHALGVVAGDFSPPSLAAALNALTAADLDRFKANAGRAARLLTWEQDREVLYQEVRRLLALRPCVA